MGNLRISASCGSGYAHKQGSLVKKSLAILSIITALGCIPSGHRLRTVRRLPSSSTGSLDESDIFAIARQAYLTNSAHLSQYNIERVIAKRGDNWTVRIFLHDPGSGRRLFQDWDSGEEACIINREGKVISYDTVFFP